MAPRLGPYLLNRYVILVVSLPAIGYLGFLSRFVFGTPAHPVRMALEALFMPALPVMTLDSSLLETLPSVDHSLGTIGFFVFTYLFALILVWGIHVRLMVVRD